MNASRYLDAMHAAGRRLARGSLLALFAALLPALPLAAATVKTPHVEAELVAASTALVPGEPLTVALRLRMEQGWHTYWRNPGDSGLPTTLAWTLPPGIAAGPIEWPAPLPLPVGPLVNYGYDGEVLLLTELKTAASAAPGAGTPLKARADWLVCKEICIPEGVDLTLDLPVERTAGPDARWGAPLAAARAALPQPLTGWQASAQGKGSTIELKLTPTVQGGKAGDLTGLRFFPYAEAKIEPAAPQTLRRDGDGFILTLQAANNLEGPFTGLAGVLTANAGLSGGLRAASLDIPLTGSVVAGPKPAMAAAPQLNVAPVAPVAPAVGGLTLAAAVMFALLGGAILNFMPCVFPVLSIKVLGFAARHDTKLMMRREAVAFACGVVLTFVALGLLLAALRAAGEQLGWGFQLQSPAVVTGLAILFFALALNMSGVFEFGQLVPSSVAAWSAHNRTLDAFGSGVLAVVVASPCTAPFMGAAMGYALAASTAVTLAVFVALGIGMALPYVLLAWFPAWRARLPRSGPWLARFKELLAFPLYATVIWLAWVLGSQRDNDAVLRLFAVLLGIGFALWAWRIVRTGGARPWGIAGIAALAGALVLAWPLLTTDADAAPPARADGGHGTSGAAESDWQSFAPAKVAALTGAGRAVFVDFTAAWCVTCQVNKRLVLNTADVRRAFAARDVTLVRADWTRRDPAITRALADLGRNGVPVYVLYRPGKEPLLLPEVLQGQNVLDALATL